MPFNDLARSAMVGAQKSHNHSKSTALAGQNSPNLKRPQGDVKC